MGGLLSHIMNDRQLRSAVSRGQWSEVWSLLNSWNMNDSPMSVVYLAFAVEQACQHADDNWSEQIVAECPDLQTGALLNLTVRRGLWKTTSRLLQRVSVYGNRDTVRWAVQEVSRYADDDTCLHIVSSSPKHVANMLLTETVRQGRWETVSKLLLSCVEFSDSDTVRWAVEEASKRATRLCAVDQTGTLLTAAVRRGLWETVSRLFHRVSVHEIRDTARWAVEEACNRAPDGECVDITRHCADDQTGTLLAVAVRRGLWKTVSSLCQLIHNRHISDSRETLRLAVEEACKQDDETQCIDIVTLCANVQPDVLWTEAVRRGLWKTVRVLLVWMTVNTDINTSWAQCRAVEEACKHADDETFRIIANYVVHGKVTPFSPTAPSTQLSGRSSRADRVNSQHVSLRVAPEHRALLVGLLRKRGLDHMATDIIQDTCEELGRSDRTEDMLSMWAKLFIHSLFAHSADHTDVPGTALTLREYLDSVTELQDKVTTLIVSVMGERNDRFTLKVQDKVWHGMHSVLQEMSPRDTDVCVHFVKWCVQRKGQTTSLCQLSLPLVASQTLNMALQHLARTSMWEETRRWYLQFLVEEKLWDIVKEVADHSVYDDQREWALAQARQDKQWDVMVLLADHGLTEKQRYRLYRQVAKYANWATVRLLFERAVDMRRVSEELMAGNPCHERPPGKIDRNDIERRRLRGENVSKLEAWYRERSERVARLTLEHNQRCTQLERLEKRQARARKDFTSILAARKWYAVLSQLRQDDVSEEQIERTLQQAIESEAWSVVPQLVRLGVDAAQRDRLFSETIGRRQWGVARMLLEHTVSEEWSWSEYSGSEKWSRPEHSVNEEWSRPEHSVSEEWSQSKYGVSEEWSRPEHGVSVKLSQATLPELMQKEQWLLVARVMEASLEDTDRLRVMQAALDKNEGSVVAHGISVMEGRVSVQQRRAMYQQALGQGTWQTVKRLVEEKDVSGLEQRDQALVAAVDRHRWDVVEHCVLQGADINKQDVAGNTMLHQKAEKEVWDSVEGLVHCGAKPNLQNSSGCSAFHITVDKALAHYTGQNAAWGAVKTSVKFHGNLNQPDPRGHTPLYRLIGCDDRHISHSGRVLDCALWWGSDVSQRVDCGGKTALHVVCQAGLWHSMQYIAARGVNPLAVTDDGRTVLMVAVEYNNWHTLHDYMEQYGEDEGFTKWDMETRECRQKLVAECIRLGISTQQPAVTDREIFGVRSFSFIYTRRTRSLVYISIKNADPVILHMLYESGSCSHGELLEVSGCPPRNALSRNDPRQKHLLHKRYKHCLSYLEKVASIPRSLKSTCRLLISRLLGVSKPRIRQKRVKQLPLPGPMRGYVLFSDLMHPDFGKDIWQQTDVDTDVDRDTDTDSDTDTDTDTDRDTYRTDIATDISTDGSLETDSDIYSSTSEKQTFPPSASTF